MSMRLLRSFAALLMLLALPAAAGVGVWTPLGPDGGTVWNLIADPSAPETLYTGSPLGILKTTDGGQTWTLLRREPDGATVIAVLNDTIYARLGTNRGLVKSTDEGRTWTVASNIPRDVVTLLADPRVPNRLWAVGRVVYLSHDNGATWQALPRPKARKPPWPTALALDPAGPWVYLATSRGFFRSADLGRTWQLGAGIRATGLLQHLAVDARNPSILYLASGQDLYRSLDRGARWHRVVKVPIEDFIVDVLCEGDRIYLAVLGAGISYSSNHGTTWTRAAQGPADPASLVASSGVVYAGTHGHGRPGGLFRTVDRGATWQRPANEGLQAVAVSALAVDPNDPDILYAGSDRSGLSRSADRGATWKPVGLGFPPGEPVNVLQILVEPSRPSTVYAILNESWLIRSDDGGQSWRRFRLEIGTLLSIALDPRRPGALWGGGFGGLFHSEDRGEHWTKVEAFGPTVLEVQVDPRDPRVVYVAAFQGHQLRLLRSADGGQTWERRDAGLGFPLFLKLAIDPASPSTLFAGTNASLYRSQDSGRTWTRLPGIGGQVNDVVAAPTSPTAIYAAVVGFGIKRSTDGGATWAPARRGLGETPVFELAVDPQDPGRLYAGTATFGVFAWDEPPGDD